MNKIKTLEEYEYNLFEAKKEYKVVMANGGNVRCPVDIKKRLWEISEKLCEFEKENNMPCVSYEE